MRIGIVENALQKGATDGAVAISESMKRQFDSKIEIVRIDPRDSSDDAEYFDVIISVGPDETEKVLEYKEKNPKVKLIGVKDPFDNDDVSKYKDWLIIVDTMWSMKGSEIGNNNKVYYPSVPTFTLDKNEVLSQMNAAQSRGAVLPKVLALLGGADPYTHQDITKKDVDGIIYLCEKFRDRSDVVAISTSTRTNDSIMSYLLERTSSKANYMVYDASSMTVNRFGKSRKSYNPYQVWAGSADNIIVTNDSLSMMAELTTLEKKLSIYDLENSKDVSRRQFVSNYVCEKGNAHIFNYEQVKSLNKQTFVEISNPLNFINEDVAREVYDALSGKERNMQQFICKERG